MEYNDTQIKEPLIPEEQPDPEHEPSDNELFAVLLDEEVEASEEDLPDQEDEPELPVGSSFKQIVDEIFTYPLLTPEEEAQCGRMLKGTPQEREQAIERLVLCNQRYVLKISQRYRVSAGILDPEDLFQEGTLGLIRAAKSFDIDRGFRFSTYATWWIRQSIGRAIADKGTTIRYPVHMREKSFQMEKILREAEKSNIQLSDEELAARMNLPVDRIGWLREMSRGVTSLNLMIGEDESTELADLVADQNSKTPEDYAMESANRDLAQELLSVLSGRERHMMEMRFGIDNGIPKTLEEIGNYYGISRERVRQIEKKCIRRMQITANKKKIRPDLL